MRSGFFILLLALGVAGGARAGSDVDAVRDALEARFPNAAIEHIAPTPIPGMFEVGIVSRVFYVSADGRFVFNGKLIDLDTRTDLSERYLRAARLRALAGFDESRMLVYEPEGATRYTISVFTDIDCPFCRQLHEQIDEYTALGIRIRYLFYPRTGIGSHSYRKAVAVWCAEDRRDELTFAKGGAEPELRDCPNPVEEHMALANLLGLSATPMIITEDGEQLMGYVSPAEFAARMPRARAAGAE